MPAKKSPTKKAVAPKQPKKKVAAKPKPKAKPALSKAPVKKSPSASKAMVKQPRRLRAPRHHFPKRRDKRFTPVVKLPSVYRLVRKTAELISNHKKVLFGIILIYGFFDFVLVYGLSAGSDLTELKNELNTFFSGNFGSFFSGATIFLTLLNSAGKGNTTNAGIYEFLLALIVSLAVIWALRQLIAGVRIRIRDAYYAGMAPIIPFLIVLAIIGLQIIPLIIGGIIYSQVIVSGIAASWYEQLMWGVLSLSLVFATLYMLCSSLFGIYIVTLPGMTPIKALRSARKLAKYRRWMIFRKLMALPVLLLLITAIIMIPIIIWLTKAAQGVFVALTILTIPVVHSYMYILYRELIRE